KVIKENQKKEKKTKKDKIEKTKEIKTEKKEEKNKKVPKTQKGKSKKTKPKKDEEAEIEQSDSSKSESDSLDEEGSDSSDSDSDIDSDDSSQGSEKKKGGIVRAKFLQPTGDEFHIQIQGPIATWASPSNEGVTVLVDKVITEGIWKITFTFQRSDCSMFITGAGFVESPYTENLGAILGENSKGCMYQTGGILQHYGQGQDRSERYVEGLDSLSDGRQISIEVNMKKKTAIFFAGTKQIAPYYDNIPSKIQFAARAYFSGTIFRIVSLTKLRKPTKPLVGARKILW
ncbi:MAG: hypothetical protein EZS28_021833, partial [Streblomastix strix]